MHPIRVQRYYFFLTYTSVINFFSQSSCTTQKFLLPLQSLSLSQKLTMNKEQLDHIIEQMQARISHDEAMAAVLQSHAAQDKQMLDLIQSQQKEIERLREQQHVTNVTNRIESFSGNYFENANQVQLCPPSSTISTEPTSSTSTPSFSTQITPLNSRNL